MAKATDAKPTEAKAKDARPKAEAKAKDAKPRAKAPRAKASTKDEAAPATAAADAADEAADAADEAKAKDAKPRAKAPRAKASTKDEAEKDEAAPASAAADAADEAGAPAMEDPLPDSVLAVGAVNEDALLDMLLDPSGARLPAAAPGGARPRKRKLSVAARREMNVPPPMMKASYYLNPKPAADRPLHTPLTCSLVVAAAKQSLMRSHGDTVDADLGDDLPHADLMQDILLSPPVMPPPSTGRQALHASAEANEPAAAPAAGGRAKRRRGPMHFTFDEVAN